MIFGFNTDIKQDGTVYHVQSEPREAEQLLQTQVFVRGQCIGKHANSYVENSKQGDFSEKKLEQMLRDQHRMVLDAIKQGKLDSVIVRAETVPGRASSLKLEWLDSNSVRINGDLVMQIMVRSDEAAVEGARVTSRFSPVEGTPLYSQAMTDASGKTEVRFAAARNSAENSAVLVQATYDGQMVTRKFRLRARTS